MPTLRRNRAPGSGRKTSIAFAMAIPVFMSDRKSVTPADSRVMAASFAEMRASWSASLVELTVMAVAWSTVVACDPVIASSTRKMRVATCPSPR